MYTSNTWFLGPARVFPTSGMSMLLAVFAGFTVVTYLHTSLGQDISGDILKTLRRFIVEQIEYRQQIHTIWTGSACCEFLSTKTIVLGLQLEVCLPPNEIFIECRQTSWMKI